MREYGKSRGGVETLIFVRLLTPSSLPIQSLISFMRQSHLIDLQSSIHFAIDSQSYISNLYSSRVAFASDHVALSQK